VIRFYSTNRNLDGVPGIVPFKDTVTFREALLQGQAPDEGLFMPDRVPRIIIKDLFDLKEAPYSEFAYLVAEAFLREDAAKLDLRGIVRDSYDFDVPLERVEGEKFIMRLDQGPTASFKDFAARMMARLMSRYRSEGARLNVLVATSGDTGSAVGEAFKGVEGISVYILYPRDEVSDMQKKQLDTIGDNVTALSVGGKFDDCQNLVKQAFSDPDLVRFNLTSANSINFGRIMPQIVYYVYAYARLAEPGDDIIFSVPSGNFGNALGCEYARRMGLPVGMLLMPTNENDEFPRFLETGRYEKVSPSRACLSNAMNVGNPSNLARFFDLYGGTVDRSGTVHRYPELEQIKRNIFSVSVSDKQTRDTIKNVYDKFGVVLEPHGAVAWKGLETWLERQPGRNPLCVSLETAHPAKFPEQIVELLGFSPQEPPSMKGIASRAGEAISMAAVYEDFKKFLLDALRTD